MCVLFRVWVGSRASSLQAANICVLCIAWAFCVDLISAFFFCLSVLVTVFVLASVTILLCFRL